MSLDCKVCRGGGCYPEVALRCAGRAAFACGGVAEALALHCKSAGTRLNGGKGLHVCLMIDSHGFECCLSTHGYSFRPSLVTPPAPWASSTLRSISLASLQSMLAHLQTDSDLIMQTPHGPKHMHTNMHNLYTQTNMHTHMHTDTHTHKHTHTHTHKHTHYTHCPHHTSTQGQAHAHTDRSHTHTDRLGTCGYTRC